MKVVVERGVPGHRTRVSSNAVTAAMDGPRNLPLLRFHCPDVRSHWQPECGGLTQNASRGSVAVAPLY